MDHTVCLDKRYRNSSMKNEANECRKPTDYIPWLFYCSVHFISSANLSQNWEYQMRKLWFCSSSSTVSFFLLLTPSCITKNLYGVRKYSTFTYSVLNDWVGPYWWSSFSGLELHVSYDWPAVASRLSPKIGYFWGFSSHKYWEWHIVRLHLDYWMHALLAVTSLIETWTNCKQKFDYSFLYLLGDLCSMIARWHKLCLEVTGTCSSNCVCACGWSSNVTFQCVRLQH